MTDPRTLARLSGLAMLAAGLLYLPLPFIGSWRSMADIGGRNWWIVYHMATIHHFFLLFGLFGLFSVQLREAGRLGVVAFVLASLGNALVGGIGIVQTTVLPALAANAGAESSLDCTPFYRPATRAAEGFIATACSGWNFDVLGVWFAISWLTLLVGGIALGIATAMARVIPWPAGVLVALGYLVMLAGIAVPLPELAGSSAIAIAGIGYAWCGWALSMPERQAKLS